MKKEVREKLKGLFVEETRVEGWAREYAQENGAQRKTLVKFLAPCLPETKGTTRGLRSLESCFMRDSYRL